MKLTKTTHRRPFWPSFWVLVASPSQFFIEDCQGVMWLKAPQNLTPRSEIPRSPKHPEGCNLPFWIYRSLPHPRRQERRKGNRQKNTNECATQQGKRQRALRTRHIKRTEDNQGGGSRMEHLPKVQPTAHRTRQTPRLICLQALSQGLAAAGLCTT